MELLVSTQETPLFYFTLDRIFFFLFPFSFFQVLMIFFLFFFFKYNFFFIIVSNIINIIKISVISKNMI